MDTVIAIIVTVFIFGLLIFIHELGHYLVARACGVGILEFAIGMGPKIYSRRGKYNLFSVRALPIGGFVSMVGEYGEVNEEELDEADRGKTPLNSKPVWQRILICLAGPVMNILLGILVMSIVVISTPVLGSTTVGGFFEQSTSNSHGLMLGDRILEIDGEKIHVIIEMNYKISVDGIEPLDILVERDGGEVLLEDVVFPVEELDGVKLGAVDFSVMRAQKSFGEVVYQSFWQSVATLELTVDSLVDTFRGRYGLSALSGPVGIGEQVGEVISSGETVSGTVLNIASMTVLISMSLGVFNLLPIPVLDGGRILFYIIEAIRRKPMDPKYENAVSALFMILLVFLMIFVLFKDIAGLF